MKEAPNLVPLDGNTLIKLSRPIEFPCVVDGQTQTASLTHEEENGLEFIYHLSFSDGHKAVFFGSEEHGAWIERGLLSSPYADAIQDDLNAIEMFSRDNLPFCIQAAEGYTVWIVPREQDETAVCYKSDFRFYLTLEGGEYVASTVARHNDFIDQEIISLVTNALYSKNQS